VTEPEQARPLQPEELPPPAAATGSRKADQVNGPSSTIGIGTGIGLGCLVLIVLLVVFGFVASKERRLALRGTPPPHYTKRSDRAGNGTQRLARC
jgi:hypothetical protein